jgi:hypothetical protein
VSIGIAGNGGGLPKCWTLLFVCPVPLPNKKLMMKLTTNAQCCMSCPGPPPNSE